MSDCQKGVARANITGRAYAMVAPVFDALPNRFTTSAVMMAGRIPRHLDGAVKSVLFRTFRCIQVGEGSGSTWKKP